MKVILELSEEEFKIMNYMVNYFQEKRFEGPYPMYDFFMLAQKIRNQYIKNQKGV